MFCSGTVLPEPFGPEAGADRQLPANVILELLDCTFLSVCWLKFWDFALYLSRIGQGNSSATVVATVLRGVDEFVEKRFLYLSKIVTGTEQRFSVVVVLATSRREVISFLNLSVYHVLVCYVVAVVVDMLAAVY